MPVALHIVWTQTVILTDLQQKTQNNIDLWL